MVGMSLNEQKSNRIFRQMSDVQDVIDRVLLQLRSKVKSDLQGILIVLSCGRYASVSVVRRQSESSPSSMRNGGALYRCVLKYAY
ncbi:unnamed protein product [Gongylonema pulchrum]|uniref:Uncharacterized protein n=1 Tax=Gongylonema pulchrum TaxID=637853 RepID=A0A183EFY9_9BILA|nr:unnamed protein product [Gongylonema pulchrum]